MRTAVVGAGSWGTALANLLAGKGHSVALWVHDPKRARALAKMRENSEYLPGFPLAPGIDPTGDLAEALDRSELIVEVVPSHAVREVMSRASRWLTAGSPLVTASKGIENGTLCTMTEVLEQVLPSALHPSLCVLSGPSFAREVSLGLPTAVSVASRQPEVARAVQAAFTTSFFRAYTSDDVVGVQLGGSLKNVIAIAAGISDGLGCGANSRAALITRGLAEISRLAVKKGAHPLTLAGLSGLGDLVLTCTGEQSRNHKVGFELGRGRALSEILGGTSMVAEGVKTARSACDLGEKLGVELPICQVVCRVLYDGLAPKQAVGQLMGREPKAELQ
jgi:glycerol-3-phosphate dehydrogenase (NAD(P)+)